MRRPLNPTRDLAGVSRLLDEGAALTAAGRLAEAAGAYERAARADPADHRALFSLATLDLRQGREAKAIPRLRDVVRLKPDLFAAWHNLGAAAQTLEHWDEAAAAYERALALRPEAAESRRNLAVVLAVLGRIDEAVAQHRRLAEDPSNRLWALTRLALLRPQAIEAAELDDLRRAATDPAIEPETRIGACFALGEVLERRGDDEAAFAAFAQGNRLRRAALEAAGGADAGPPAVLAAHQKAARRVIASFSAERLRARKAHGLATRAPIFIVGMPRSGSTLVEQILARHAEVQSFGETGALPMLLERRDASAAGDLRALGRDYLAAIRQRGWRGARRFIDKTLENFLHVGAIALMFPEAVILHTVRDPLDTCLSCYRQLFASGAETLYDLAEIGAEYVLYRSVMDHWRAVLPGRVIDVDHEALVDEPEAGIRWLVTEACGLVWDDACLAFHEGAAPVRTASAGQVRQPIFRTSIDRWRRYEAQLGPLVEALGPYAAWAPAADGDAVRALVGTGGPG